MSEVWHSVLLECAQHVDTENSRSATGIVVLFITIITSTKEINLHQVGNVSAHVHPSICLLTGLHKKISCGFNENFLGYGLPLGLP